MMKVVEVGKQNRKKRPTFVADAPDGTVLRGRIRDLFDGRTYSGIWLIVNSDTIGTANPSKHAVILNRNIAPYGQLAMLDTPGDTSRLVFETYEELDATLTVASKN